MHKQIHVDKNTRTIKTLASFRYFKTREEIQTSSSALCCISSRQPVSFSHPPHHWSAPTAAVDPIRVMRRCESNKIAFSCAAKNHQIFIFKVADYSKNSQTEKIATSRWKKRAAWSSAARRLRLRVFCSLSLSLSFSLRGCLQRGASPSSSAVFARQIRKPPQSAVRDTNKR